MKQVADISTGSQSLLPPDLPWLYLVIPDGGAVLARAKSPRWRRRGHRLETTALYESDGHWAEIK